MRRARKPIGVFELKDRWSDWMDDGCAQAINSVIAHQRVLTTHFQVPNSFKDNNIIDKMWMKLKMI